MRRDRASRTAAWVAGWRGLGAILGAAQLVDVRFGARFGGAWAERLAAIAATARGQRVLARLPPLVHWAGYMQVRTRVIDDELRAFVAAIAPRAPQVVILGAGYDCRAARLPELVAVRVFEVDHPATQARKRAVLAELRAPHQATYVEWDFEAEPLAELPAELARHGLDRAAPTFVIWEGVTMYLTAPTIDATLAMARSLGGSGTRLCFNYVRRDQLDRPDLAARAMLTVVARIGEPFKFGWDPAALPAHLAVHGWRLLHDRDGETAAHQRLPPSVARFVGGLGRHIATAISE